MKILQVSHGLPPKENAGVELYTFYLAKALSQLGHRVHLFCREGDPGREDFSVFEDQINGVSVTRAVNNLTRLPSLRAHYDNHFFDRAFSDTLRREKPDLIHFQHLFGLSANLIRVAKQEAFPVALTLHDFFLLCHRFHLLKKEGGLCPGPLYGLECASCLECTLHPQDIRTRWVLKWKEKLPYPVIQWASRFLVPVRYLEDKGYEVFHRYRYLHEILKAPDLLIVPSQFVQTVFLRQDRFMGSKMVVLGLGVPPIGPDQSPSIKGVDGTIRFCYFGNILHLKGLHVLIEAFRGLPRGRAALTIYGRRDPWNEVYYDQLKRQAADLSVDFRGPFQRENLGKALRDQDVMVLPSICYESYSFVIREALSLGLPVIASRIGALPEAVEEGVNGLLFNPGDPEDLKRCMLRLIEEPGCVERMASKTRKCKSMEEHATEVIRLYQKVIGQGGTK